MNNIDNATIARVWQRVHPGEKAFEPSLLKNLLYREKCTAATYLQLQRQLAPVSKPLLQRLYRQKQETVACLQGLLILADQVPPPAAVMPYRGKKLSVLQQCYREQVQCASLYNEHRDDPECGPVLFQLGQQARQHCQALLQLMGTISAKDNYPPPTKPVYISPKR